MDVNDLRIFLTVADELHFGRAGQRLFLPQPHVSRAVAKLERELGVELFRRTTRRVELTPAGEVLTRAAQTIVSTSDMVRQEVRAAERGVVGRVSMSFAGPSSHAAVGTLGRAMAQRFPQIEMVFLPGRFGPEAVDHVVGGSTDLAMARFTDTPSGVSARPIAAEHYVVAVPSGHPLAARGVVSLSELRDEPFLTLPSTPGSAVRSDFLNWCRRAGFVPNIVQTAPDSWTIAALVAAGVGLNFTVDAAVEPVSVPGVQVLRLAEDTEPTYAYLAWRTDSTNPALATVLAVAEEVLPTPDDGTRG